MEAPETGYLFSEVIRRKVTREGTINTDPAKRRYRRIPKNKCKPPGSHGETSEHSKDFDLVRGKGAGGRPPLRL